MAAGVCERGDAAAEGGAECAGWFGGGGEAGDDCVEEVFDEVSGVGLMLNETELDSFSLGTYPSIWSLVLTSNAWS